MEYAPPVTAAEADLSLGRRSHARYVLRQQLARGGMGIIHAAYDRVARREVVYKQLSLDDPSYRASRTTLFRREYDALARLSHPNIVEVYDYGEDDGTPYYVMERIGGADLASVAPLPLFEACRIARDIASALALIHTRRLVHRDVSPNNVRLTDDGTAKLLDFGALTPFGVPDELVGTPGFIAPESYHGAALDQRSDLYALGALLYWVLTRRTPYGSLSIEELEVAFAEPPMAPSAYVELPAELDRLVLSLLAIDPSARPADASYVIDRLTSIAKLPPEADEGRVAQSYLAHPPLSGRRAVLDVLHAAIDQAQKGRGVVALVEGDAGLGRSAALSEAAQHAQLQGVLVLRARGDGSGDPFRVARTLLEAAIALYPELAPAAARNSTMRFRLEGRPGKSDNAVSMAERHAVLLESARRTLLDVSARHPLALIVDDLERVDEQSLALLAALAQDISGARVALIASSLREGASRGSPEFALLVAGARRVALGPLDKAGVGELVAALFGPVPNALKLAHWLHERGGGNPATTLDLLRLAMQRGQLRYTLGTFTLPFDIARELADADLGSAVLARLGDLRAEVAKVALALGLHCGWLTPDELAVATALAPREVQLALEDLVARGAAARSERGYQLLGSALREALRRTSRDEERRALHGALGRALLQGATVDPKLRYDACLHLFHAGEDDEALGQLVGRVHSEMGLQDAVQHADLLELALASAQRKGRSKEECLSLLLPLARTGFHGSAQRHAVYIDTALGWMADVCGMSLAKRLRRYLGLRLSLMCGLIYAAIRLGRKPKGERLGSLGTMLAHFVLLVCDSTALACAACDAPACRRFTAWLDPLAVLPKTSPGWIMREFCLATCELAAGQPNRCIARYAALAPRLLQPIAGLEESRAAVYRGAINGRGLAEAALGSAEALRLAQMLDSDAFYAAFAEGIRFEYHAIRGDRDTALACRARAEQLALHGGTSWTASSSLAQVSAFAATLSEDAIALVQVISEFERLAISAPALDAYKRICEAWLEHVRGNSQAALARFEQVIETDAANGLIFALVNRSLYAAVLNALGHYDRAQVVCERMAADPLHQGEKSLTMRTLLRQLAVALGGQGRFDEALALSGQQLSEALPFDNPLELGSCHRDRARIALLARDRAAFDVHFGEMQRYFHQTKNSSLRRQCDRLLAEAERCGLRAPTPRLSQRPTEQALDDATYIGPSGVRG